MGMDPGYIARLVQRTANRTYGPNCCAYALARHGNSWKQLGHPLIVLSMYGCYPSKLRNMRHRWGQTRVQVPSLLSSGWTYNSSFVLYWWSETAAAVPQISNEKAYPENPKYTYKLFQCLPVRHQGRNGPAHCETCVKLDSGCAARSDDPVAERSE